MGQYSSLFDEEKPQAPNPAIAVQLTADAVPQQEARYKELATRYKVPVDLVRTLPKDYEEKAKVDDIDKATANQPHLRSWLADTNNAAMVDVPDVSTLSSIGDLMRQAFPGRSMLGTMQDVGVTAAKGVVAVPQAVAGFFDMFSGGHVGKALEDAGVNLKDAQTILSLYYSQAQQNASHAVSDAKGFTGTIGAALKHPSTILSAVGESIPAMLGGGAVGRGVVAVAPKIMPWLAAALGEGVVGAGSMAENLRADNPDRLLGAKQTFASVMAGAGTALFGAAGGKLAQRLGIADIDTALVKGGMPAATASDVKFGFVKNLAAAGVSEGLFEELPQSMQEQMWQNFAKDKPLGEGVLEAGAMGLLAGAAGGTGFQILSKAVTKGVEGASAEHAKVQQAEQSLQHLGQIMALAGQSKLRERSPQTFAEVSQEMADKTEGAPTEVRFDARTLGEVLNQEELAMLPSISSQMEEALATGGEVSVPIGELMANAAGTPLEQKLTEHARVGDNELSAFEAKEAAAQAETYLQDEAKRVIAESADSIGTQASADTVKQSLLDQFTSLGRFTPDVNGAYATIASNMYTALASRLGMTPEQAYAAHPLTLDGVNPATQGDVLNTDSLAQEAKTKLPKKAKASTAVEIRQGSALRGDAAMSIADIGNYFDKITGKRDFNDPKEQKRALKTLVTELQHQVQQEKSGLDWYDADTKAAFESTKEFIPELDSEQKRQLFSVIVGLQSPGTNARDNWVIAAEAFKHFTETGVVPARNPATGGLWQGGVTSATKEKTLTMLNNMVQDMGEQAATDWLMSEHTVAELNAARAQWGGMGAAVAGKADDKLMGLFAFGPKLAPFIMNINGLHELTIDVWASRSFGRLFGQVVGSDGKIIEAPTEPQRRVMKDLLNGAAEQLNIKPYQAQALLWFFEQQLYNHLGSGSASWGFSDGAKRYADRERNARDQGVLFQTGDSSSSASSAGDLNDTGNGRGSDQSGGIAPLEGAPTVRGATGPDPRLVSVAEQYALDNGIPLQRQAEYVQVDPERAARIAAAYDAMPHAPQDPLVKLAYAELIAQTTAQYEALEKAGYKFWFFDENNDPYAGNPWNAMRDLRENKSMGVFASEAGFGSGATDLNVDDNPMLADTGIEWSYGAPDGPKKRVLANDLFRAVHDAFGHGLEGAGFRAQGEENAWQAHSRMFTGLALGAITSETRGQNSWLNYGPHGEQNRNAKVEDTVFADQKTGLMPEWTWTEGRAGDMPRDVQEQTEQRKMRQALDLLVLQPSEGGDAAPVPQTETEAFKNWFGDSKVVDVEGKPLVVYHGTGNSFDTFANSYRDGFYFFSTDPTFAAQWGEEHAEGLAYEDGEEAQGVNVMPVYVSAKKPWDYKNKADVNALLRYLKSEGIEFDSKFRDGIKDGDWLTIEEEYGVVDAIKALGYDGVWMVEDGSRNLAVSDPTQIKSAIGNNGNFDPNDANILHQGAAAPGSLNLTGVHFSKESRATLDGRFYGSGLKGAERDRVNHANDYRLRSRLYFYVDEGKGVRSEAGVGGNAHEAQIENVYDIKADPLKLVTNGDLNQTETNILNAGFNGYYVSDAFNGQGAAVLLGEASHGVASSPISNPNQPLPSTQAAQPYKRGLSSKELNSVNLEEVQKVAPSAQIKAGTFQVSQDELAAAQQAMADQGIPLPLPNTLHSSTARGTFNPKSMTISLLEGADLSTFHHEMAHFYLEVLAHIASQDNAPAAISNDMDVLLKWFKVKDLATWNAMTLAQKRESHEKFAEHYEHYLFEGKSPNMEMQHLFQRFSSWMKSVYKSLSDFMASRNTQLTDEVRGVYDRMLATEAQIVEAEQSRKFAPLFKSAEEVGMSPTEWAQYQMAANSATEDAIENLQKRSLRDLKWAVSAKNKAVKAATKDVEEKRKATEAEVRAEVEAMPVYAAKAALDKIEGKPTDADIQMVSEWFNYGSPDEMLQEMADAQPIKHVIEGMTDQRLLERYGDLTTPQGIERAANEAVHNEARAKFVATELKALSEGVRLKTPDRTTILEKLKECLAT